MRVCTRPLLAAVLAVCVVVQWAVVGATRASRRGRGPRGATDDVLIPPRDGYMQLLWPAEEHGKAGNQAASSRALVTSAIEHPFSEATARYLYYLVAVASIMRPFDARPCITAFRPHLDDVSEVSFHADLVAGEEVVAITGAGRLPPEGKPIIFVAVRGTINAEQLKQQIVRSMFVDLKPEVPGAGSPNYFVEAARRLRASIVPALKQLRASHPEAVLVLTGFSMGGAISQILALLLGKGDGIPPHLVYTFGSPRTGNLGFVRAYQELGATTYRVTIQSDPVPLVPMCWAKRTVVGGTYHSVCSTKGALHTPTEVYYTLEDMPNFNPTLPLYFHFGPRKCTGEPAGEDPSCTNSASTNPFGSSVRLHRLYFGINVTTTCETMRSEIERGNMVRPTMMDVGSLGAGPIAQWYQHTAMQAAQRGVDPRTDISKPKRDPPPRPNLDHLTAVHWELLEEQREDWLTRRARQVLDRIRRPGNAQLNLPYYLAATEGTQLRDVLRLLWDSHGQEAVVTDAELQQLAHEVVIGATESQAAASAAREAASAAAATAASLRLRHDLDATFPRGSGGGSTVPGSGAPSELAQPEMSEGEGTETGEGAPLAPGKDGGDSSDDRRMDTDTGEGGRDEAPAIPHGSGGASAAPGGGG